MNPAEQELRRVRVTAIHPLAAGVLRFELAPADGRPLAPFAAGSHIDVHTPCGIVRQYSLCGDPAGFGGDGATANLSGGGNYAIAVKNDPAGQGGSSSMHAGVEVDSLLGIAGPRNLFPLVAGAQHSVFVAGGIGITPIYAMIHALEAAGASWELHYCARSEQHAAFYTELSERFAGKVRTYFSDVPLLPVEALVQGLGADTHLYCCGPAGLMQAVQAACPPAAAPRMHFEWFAAPAVPHAKNERFQVQLASSGTVLDIPPERSVLQVLREHGVDVPSACEEGVCGTCETRVLAGQVDHRDALLSGEERQANRSMMVCVSRAGCGRIVLDL